MADTDSADHMETLIANVGEVRRLLGIHERLTAKKVRRREGVEVLNKSGIVLLVACWEAFVEDLAVPSFEALVAQARSQVSSPRACL